MTDERTSGRVAKFTIETLDDESVRLEIALRDGPLLRFEGVTGLRLGERHEALPLTIPLHLDIRSIADHGLEGVAFQVASAEQDWNLSFGCASWSEA